MELFKSKCSICGQKKSTVHEKPRFVSKHKKIKYCKECWDFQLKLEEHRTKIEMMKQEERLKREIQKQEEIKRQDRYEYLKREIELIELEEKAKELGIE